MKELKNEIEVIDIETGVDIILNENKSLILHSNDNEFEMARNDKPFVCDTCNNHSIDGLREIDPHSPTLCYKCFIKNEDKNQSFFTR